MTARADGFWALIRTAEPPELGPGPRAGVLPFPVLAGRFDAWAGSANLSASSALRLRATAYLHHDHADPAHDLVQDLSDPDGALIHGILHRREPDFWNAKYWFRQAENHPIFPRLTARVREIKEATGQKALVDRLTLSGTLDPHALVDAVEEASRRSAGDPEVWFLRLVQLVETECLADHLLGD